MYVYIVQDPLIFVNAATSNRTSCMFQNGSAESCRTNLSYKNLKVLCLDCHWHNVAEIWKGIYFVFNGCQRISTNGLPLINVDNVVLCKASDQHKVMVYFIESSQVFVNAAGSEHKRDFLPQTLMIKVMYVTISVEL